jgi:hypothetical protein
VADEFLTISPEVTSRMRISLLEPVNASVFRSLTIEVFDANVKPDAPENFNSIGVAVVSVLLPVQTPTAAWATTSDVLPPRRSL